VCNYWLIN